MFELIRSNPTIYLFDIQVAQNKSLHFFETSAKTGEGVKEVDMLLLLNIFNNVCLVNVYLR